MKGAETLLEELVAEKFQIRGDKYKNTNTRREQNVSRKKPKRLTLRHSVIKLSKVVTERES